MGYKTDLHVHSKEASFCANCPAEIIAEKYAAAGYRTIVLANHFNHEYIIKSPEGTFDSAVKVFFGAYEKLTHAAGGALNVILAMEARFAENYNDYLIFGETEKFIDFSKRQTEFVSMGIKKYSEAARAEGFLVVQAHPFRHHMTVINPSFLDGIEVHNGHIGHNSNNDIAHAWAKKHGKLATSGSDHHDIKHPITGGIITESPIDDSVELMRVLRSGEFTLIEELEAAKIAAEQ